MWPLALLSLLLLACMAGSEEGTPTSHQLTPAGASLLTPPLSPVATPTPAGTAEGPPVKGGPSGPGTYIALGDSLTAGVGAPAGSGFVDLVARALGQGMELLNLGHPGDTSAELIEHGHLDRALGEIGSRDSDGRPNNDVRLVTITIGGNDLLDLLPQYVLQGQCPSREALLSRPECLSTLRAAMGRLAANLDAILSRLRQAAPQVPIVVVTLYNPFSGRDQQLGALGDLALEGEEGTALPTGVNDVIRDAARRHNVLVADVFPPFQGRSPELVSSDMIHPNQSGYRVMAEAVLSVLGVPSPGR